MSTRKKTSPSKPTPPASATPSRRAPKVPRPTGVMGLEEIKSLIALVGREPFQEFEFEAGDMKFRIRKDSIHAPAPQVTYAPAQPASPFGSPNHLVASAQMASAQATPAPTAEPMAPVDEPGLHYITSPIVGTFYRSANPSSPSFVNPGDHVRPGQTLCIVEAMKLMNEIESDISGEIIKVLVENGQPVEYGERLFQARVG